MTGGQGRKLLLAASLALFACLLITGAQRLIGCETEPAKASVPRLMQAYLCSTPSCETEAGTARVSMEGTRSAQAALPTGRLCALPGGVSADANGNVITSGVSYLRSVYQAFALGDGFA